MNRASKHWVVIMVLVVMVGVPMTITGGRLLEHHVPFCVSCHEMKHYDEEWRLSGASEHHPNCIECHSGPDLTGIIEAEFRGLKQLWVHFTVDASELKPPFKANVPDGFCVQCHSHSSLQKAHRNFKVEGYFCRECHRHSEGWDFAGELRVLHQGGRKE